jgi:hypothetical protein
MPLCRCFLFEAIEDAHDLPPLLGCFDHGDGYIVNTAILGAFQG